MSPEDDSLIKFKRIYRTPREPLVELTEPIDEESAFDHFFSAIEWYKASCFEMVDPSKEDRLKLLESIVGKHGLATFSIIFETFYFGVNGLNETVIDSSNWAEWKFKPGRGEISEQLWLSKAKIGVTLGPPEKEVRLEMYRQEYPHKGLHHTRLFINNEEYDDLEEFPEVDIRRVRVVPNKQLVFVGVNTSTYTHFDLKEGEEEIFILALGSTGDIHYRRMERTSREILSNPVAYRKRLTEKLSDPQRFRAFSNFVLPYFDTPSVKGVHFMLPEEF